METYRAARPEVQAPLQRPGASPARPARCPKWHPLGLANRCTLERSPGTVSVIHIWRGSGSCDEFAFSAFDTHLHESVIQSELGDLESGVSLLQSKLGARKEVVAHSVALDSAEAEARANAYFRMRARRFVTGTAIVQTSGDYDIGKTVTFRELDAIFNGDYVFTGLQHLFDRSGGGLRTELLVERPGIGR